MKPSARFLAWTATAWVISAVALAQTVPPPEPGAGATPGQSNPDRTDPSTSTPSTINPKPDRAISEESSRQSRSQDTDMSTAAERRPKVGREARLGGISAGSIVQSPAGENIGRVKDIVPDANTGDPAYIVIATRSGTTAVPYATIAPMYQNGHVVLDRARLDSAPHVTDDQLRNDNKDAAWKKEADRYWESRHPPSLQ
jgi:hypothetical protein